MKSAKHGAAADCFLHVTKMLKMPTHMSKWLTSEQWVDMIKSSFDFERKEEKLEGKVLNCVLGRDERLKRFTDVHSN